MRKKWKKILKVVLPVVVILFSVYHLVFYTVKLPKDYAKNLETNYGEYILLSHSIDMTYFFPRLPEFRLLSNLAGDSGKYAATVDRTLFFFRWDADAIKENLMASFKKSVEEIGEMSAVVNYTYDEENFDVDITFFASDDKEYYDALDAYEELKTEYSFIRRFCKYDSGLKRKNGRLSCNKVSSKKEESGHLEEEDLYNERELSILEDILSRSKYDKYYDLKVWDKVEWSLENGGNAQQLDLSDYFDISGELDLSEFSELKYISLKNMRISKVILPDSLEYIDGNTFKNCNNLREITIPKKVEELLNPVFENCNKLKKITFEGDAPYVKYSYKDIFKKVPEDLIIYRKKSAKGWQEICWDKYDVRIIDE